jgi:CRISPR-associated protein (TIGR02710 family)
VTAIESLKPDRVVFLCSDDSPAGKGSYLQVIGTGKVIKSKRDLEKPDLPNIATLAGLKPDQYEVIKIQNLDNLEDCYRGASDVISFTRRRYVGARLVADYTGGTKSMTAGLALAAIDDEQCEVNLVTGTRADLIQVRDQTQFSRPIVVWDLRAKRKLGEVMERLARFDYAGAVALLETIGQTPIGEGLRQRITSGIAICRALDHWDRFNHHEARVLLEPYRKELVDHWVVLTDLCRDEPADPYIRVEDLLLNAERRASQGRYDDAVARSYRALELIAQTRLKDRYGLDTSDTDSRRIPEALRKALERYRSEDGKVRIPLFAAWTLLSDMNDEGLGSWFRANKGKLQDFLGMRNASILAHGKRPISKSDFEGKGQAGIALCREALASVPRAQSNGRPVPQLPTKLRILE